MSDWQDNLQQAHDLHHRAIVIDTHCDTTQRLADPAWDFKERHTNGHVDLPRLREGGIGAVFFAVYAPIVEARGANVQAAREQIERVRWLTERLDDHVVLVRTADQIRAAKQSKRVAIVLAIEGGHLIEESLDVLREYHAAGAAYLTLTHATHNALADSAGVHEPLGSGRGGLTDFGRKVVREMNRIGMMVDVSHLSDEAFWDVVETSTAPIIASHSSCRAVSPHRRNLTDDMMRAIAASGGVVQINFASLFIDPNHPPIDIETIKKRQTQSGILLAPISDYKTPLSCLVEHFEHAISVIGYDHVGIGSDFDGVPAVPADMEDCSKLPNLTAALLARGHAESDLVKVLGENVLRMFGHFNRE